MSVSLIQPHLATKGDGLFEAKFVSEVGQKVINVRSYRVNHGAISL